MMRYSLREPTTILGIDRSAIMGHSNRCSVLQNFSSNGSRCCLAAEGAAAVRVAGMHRFDVILSDIGLPDGDGWTLMEEMRGKTQAYAIAMSEFGAAADVGVG